MSDLVKEYARTVRVASYEVGAQCILKLSVLLRMCQETSEQNLDLLGLSYEKMCADGFVFLLITNRAKIKRMPVHNELLTIKTHPRGVSGAQFYRDFKVYSGEELIVEIMQTSIVADANTHKILRPKIFLDYGIFSQEKIPAEDKIAKVSVPDTLPLVGERPVRYSDLDYNCHMNNTIYGDIIMDFLPGGGDGLQFSEVQINYINESTLGNVLKIYAGEQDGELLMQGVNERGCGFTVSAKLMPISKEEIDLARTCIQKE